MARILVVHQKGYSADQRAIGGLSNDSPALFARNIGHGRSEIRKIQTSMARNGHVAFLDTAQGQSHSRTVHDMQGILRRTDMVHSMTAPSFIENSCKEIPKRKSWALGSRCPC